MDSNISVSMLSKGHLTTTNFTVFDARNNKRKLDKKKLLNLVYKNVFNIIEDSDKSNIHECYVDIEEIITSSNYGVVSNFECMNYISNRLSMDTSNLTVKFISSIVDDRTMHFNWVYQ